MTSHRVYRVSSALFLALIVAAGTLKATTIVMPTDEQLIEKTPLIVAGEVVRSSPVLIGNSVWTETVLRVETIYKGSVANPEITIRELGGVLEDRQTIVFGAPEYVAGEQALVFLWPNPRGHYQTRDLFVGKFSEQYTTDGRRIWFREGDLPGTMLLDQNFEEIESPDVQRDAQGFQEFIRDRVAGRPGQANYGIENPEILRPLIANFTLIAEPTIYRWFAFDDGSSVPWYSVGSQPGYSDGGVSEAKSGIAAWTGYSSADIRYAYAGVSGSSPGGLERSNGINEIIFNDPLDEIDGTWTGSGVLGRGGFNRVSGTRSWTSPFSADGTHIEKTYSAYNITEGNLVIQDGASPSTGISSTLLAEILAHEFGHTLGFGHSSDSTALMYASVAGRGPSLRTDDQTAARWLYPSGSSSGSSIPSAPSNAASSALSSTSAKLTWKDNSSEETKQTIYIAIGSGSFSRWGDVGAGVTSATIGSLSPGQTYSFRVTASNSEGESSPSNTATVTLPSDGVTAAFTVSPSSGTVSVTNFAFYDQSSGPVVSWLWTFGDGTSSSQQNPTHKYVSSGTFTVKLVVKNSSGASSSTSKNISVSESGVSAGFTVSPSSGTAGVTNFAFYDQSSGPVVSWLWTFGDGTSSSQQNPTHKYANAGTFTVKLVVKNSSGASSSTSKTISVSAPTVSVVAAFDVSSTNVEQNKDVRFYDRSSGSPAWWKWEFGDGTTSNVQNPVHRFTQAGNYTVKLTAGKTGSSSSSSRTISVWGNAAFESVLPMSSLVAGLGGSSWRTDLTLFNASSFGASVRIILIPRYDGSSQSRTVSLSAGRSISWNSVLKDLFGLDEGAGALRIEATSSQGTPDIRVASRTYTVGPWGTYGQFVGDVPGPQIPSRLYLTGIESSGSFRTNIGLVNSSSSGVSSTLTLYESNGSVLARQTLQLPPNSFQQMAIKAIFPILESLSRSGLSIEIVSSRADVVSVYAAVVDNISQDPIYAPARPAETQRELIVPVVGRTGGAHGTYWRSDLAVFNPGSSSMTLTLRFLRSGFDNRSASSRTIALGSRSTTTLRDVVTWLGGGENLGSLEISWSGSSTGPVVTSRTYTTRGFDAGTLGQSIAALAAGSSSSTATITGLSSSSTYRSNLGVVNRGDNSITVTLTMMGPDGRALGKKTLGVQAKSHIQGAIGDLFPNVNVSSLGRFTIRVSSTAPTMFAYGTVVDNQSGDPIFVPGR